MAIRARQKLIAGIGINDADYEVFIPGKFRCRKYTTWTNMLLRCYSASFLSKRPTYEGCSVCKEWLCFSAFSDWLDSQDWQEKEIDKDLLIEGNKVYSPDTCCLIDHSLNKFLTNRSRFSGDFKTGVSFKKSIKKFVSYCSNPFTGKIEHIGVFGDEDSAHLAWKKRKHELACQLADMQTDERVANALRARYL